MADSRTAYELNEIPLFNSIIGVYSRTKSSNAIFTLGCSVAEKGVNWVVDNVVETLGCGETIDAVTSALIFRVKESYPILQRPPEKIYRKAKSKTTRYIKRRAKSVLRTGAGQSLLSAFDALTEASSSAYRHLKKSTKHSRTRTMKTTASVSEKNVQTEMMSPTKASRGQQTRLTGADDHWVKTLTRKDDQIAVPNFSFAVILMFPLELFVRFLRFIQRTLHSLADKPTETRRSNRRKIEPPPLTPEKIQEIGARRKVSPRKRINTSIIRNIKSAAFKMLGFESSCVKQTDIRQFLSCSKHKTLNESPVVSGDDTEKKRKHDDILSETEDESDDEDLVNMDLKNYVSDEDPDYEPTDEDEDDVTIDSEEEEEEESDLETEEMEGLLMLKDKENQKPSEQKIVDRPKGNENVVDKSKETKGKTSPKKSASSPRKSVLSPKKQSNTNIQPVPIVNKSPVKTLAGKDDKKEQKSGLSCDQGKQPEVGTKPNTPQNNGNIDKQQGNKKS